MNLSQYFSVSLKKPCILGGNFKGFSQRMCESMQVGFQLVSRCIHSLKIKIKGDVMSKTKLNRLALISEFESAPDSMLFNQNTLAAILDCSTQLLERNRWAGEGVPYLKIGRKVLYRKSDVLSFIQQQKIYRSTCDQGQLASA